MAKSTSKKKPATQLGSDKEIFIKGAKTHNLKNIDVSIPKSKLVVVTGVSGSGKSSLTIDTLFAEGQRRYAESLNAYVRQFMQRMDKPDVDYIKGLSPAIAIEQKVITRTSRSTVGSMTEMNDFLRLLYARVGKTISPVSGKEVKKHDVGDVVKGIRELATGSKVLLLVTFKTHANRNHEEELNILLQKGFSRIAVIDAKSKAATMHHIEDLLETPASVESILSSNKKQQVYVVIDRLVVKEFEEEDIHRISDSVDAAFFEGEGECYVQSDNGEMVLFSNKFELDGLTFEEPVPNLFSFNNPYGACPTCEGFGTVLGIDDDLVFPDKSLSVYEGAIAPWRGDKSRVWLNALIKASVKFDFPIHTPVNQLTKEQYKLLWKGNNYFDGIDAFFAEVASNQYKIQFRILLSRFRGRAICPECEGYKLRKEALCVKLYSRFNKKDKMQAFHIGEVNDLPIKDLSNWLEHLDLNEFEAEVAKRILTELDIRVKTMLDVGLGYLTLSRQANTLSGGESQRIQLTRSLGSNLTNSLYILDEPSIGLHSRDTEKLIGVLKNLRDLDNTVVVVEHDEMIMEHADYIIDMGPLASYLGGEVVAAGDYKTLIKNDKSLTGQYLSGKMSIEPPAKLRKWRKSITVKGAKQNNLKNIDVEFPLECLAVVTGVSGSGKTTLVKQILYPALMRLKGEGSEKVGLHSAIEGDIKAITQIEIVDQNPIGKSSRSNPVTYVKAYDAIRDLYSKQQLSKVRGYQPKHFSYNVDGGRCDACKGEGVQVVEMQFLADVHLTCEVCKGKRFKEEVLEITIGDKSIADILELSVDESLEFFKSIGKNGEPIIKAIKPLSDVGLGYVKLGQSSDTLSGGEAQRIKLASFLGKGKAAGHVLFIFDEPTTGLHFHDIKKLLQSFNALIDQGHSVLIIEHNMDVIKSADWVIDLGPEAGDGGGELVFAGTPEDLKSNKMSLTATYLK